MLTLSLLSVLSSWALDSSLVIAEEDVAAFHQKPPAAPPTQTPTKKLLLWSTIIFWVCEINE